MRRSTGIVIGAAIAGVALVVGIVIAVVGGSRVGAAGDLLPDLRDVQSDGTPFTVDMRPGLEWRVFVQDPQLGSAPAITCQGAGVTVREPSSTMTYTRGTVEWERILILTVDEPGEYAVSCVADPATTGMFVPRLAMQDAVDPNTAGTVLTGVAAILVGLAIVLAGLLVGGLVALLAALKGRRSP